MILFTTILSHRASGLYELSRCAAEDRRRGGQTFCYVSTKLACMIPGACQSDQTRMSGGRVTDHQLSINSVHGGTLGVSVSRSDYVRVLVGFHVEIATSFPSALSLFLSPVRRGMTSSYDDDDDDDVGDTRNNEVLRYKR